MNRAIRPPLVVAVGIGVLMMVGCISPPSAPGPTPSPPADTSIQAPEPTQGDGAAPTEPLAEEPAQPAPTTSEPVEAEGRDLPPEILAALPAAPAPSEDFRADDPILVGNTDRLQFVEFFTYW